MHRHGERTDGQPQPGHCGHGRSTCDLLAQAAYKPLRISGHTRGLGPGDLKGPVFLGTATPASPLHTLPHQLGVFASKHSLDMKFTEADHWWVAEVPAVH